MLWPFPNLLQEVDGEIRFSKSALEMLAREVVTRVERPAALKPKARKWLDVPAGTRWNEILITFENMDAVTIHAPGMPHGETLTFDDLGFWDDRSSNPASDHFVQDKY